MSDIVAMEESSLRRRTRSLSNDTNNNDTTTSSNNAALSSSPPQQTNNNAPPPTTNINNDNIVILSLKDQSYKEIIWTKFNILGRTRDNTREENVAYELWTNYIQSNVTFYRLERGGDRIQLTNDEALEREFYLFVLVCYIILILLCFDYLVWIIYFAERVKLTLFVYTAPPKINMKRNYKGY